MKFFLMLLLLIYLMVGLFDVRVTPHGVVIHQQKNVTLFAMIKDSLNQ